MSYDAKVYNVMIASPADVAAERLVIRDVIYEWNAINSQKRNIVLLPVGWETHTSPEMGATPQEIINKQVLLKCDLLVGVFWTRIGTTTTDYTSGTVEEIERYISAKKPTMLYFSGQPASMDLVDLGQVKMLKEFRDSCINRGLYETYDSISKFKDKFCRQLQIKVNEDSLFVSSHNEPDDNILVTNTNIPQLSEAAKTIVREAVSDSRGTILFFRTLSGTTLQVNEHNLIASEDRREIASWEAAIEQLENNELIVARGDKGEIYELTEEGYKIAEYI